MSNHISENNKRIAKNTMILYIRTFFVMLISLYTTRVILNVLGIEDYGVYQVVGGLVSMFSVLTASLSSAISRFITFEIGHGNQQRLVRIFATSLLIQVILAIILFIGAEMLGWWFMRTNMQIPEGRMQAAQWVLHCSIITFCIDLIRVPYNACIIAHEQMKFFAYVSLLESICKLFICFLLFIAPIDKLIFYVISLLLLSILIRIIYIRYCHKHFWETKTKLIFDKQVFKEMFGFAGWNFLSHSGHYFNTQGVTVLINIYWGVTVNAARGLATQVELAVKQFVQNFTISINPQITKSYASRDIDRMHILVCRGAKFSFFAMMLMSLPLFCEIEYILSIWLVEVPLYTSEFIRLALIMAIIDCIGISGYTACMATGKLKKYAIVITLIEILEFPLAWAFLKMGYAPTVVYYVYICIKFAVLVVRMFFLQSMVNLNIHVYISNVFFPIIRTLIAVIPSVLIIKTMSPSFLRFCISILVGIVSMSISALYLGMTRNERDFILQKIKQLILRIIK
jgi:O-antigen/teichoic acid export membrane protein